MGNETKDKRLAMLENELASMVDTINDHLSTLDKQIRELQQKHAETYAAGLEKINQQRGRIAEREYAIAETPVQSNEKATLSVLPGNAGAILNEAQKEA